MRSNARSASSVRTGRRCRRICRPSGSVMRSSVAPARRRPRAPPSYTSAGMPRSALRTQQRDAGHGALTRRRKMRPGSAKGGGYPRQFEPRPAEGSSRGGGGVCRAIRRAWRSPRGQRPTRGAGARCLRGGRGAALARASASHQAQHEPRGPHETSVVSVTRGRVQKRGSAAGRHSCVRPLELRDAEIGTRRLRESQTTQARGTR
jgi:hypothetical protein